MLVEKFQVESDNVQYTEDAIQSSYTYQTTDVSRDDKGAWVVKPKQIKYEFKTNRKVPKLG